MIAPQKRALVLSLIDQVAVSVANLALTFWLINRWPPAQFGVFAIVTSLALSGLAAHQALAGSQLSLMISRAANAEELRQALSTTWTMAIGVASLIGTVTCLGFVLLDPAAGTPVAVLAGLFVGTSICREHVRTYHFARFEAGQVLLNDLLHSGIVFGALTLALLAGLEIDLVLVAAVLMAASVIAMLPTLLQRPLDFAVHLDSKARPRMRRLWREHASWALMGAAASEMQTRGHVFAVGTFFGVAELGVIQAAFILLRPISLLNSAWVKVARPVMAREFAERRPAAASR